MSRVYVVNMSGHNHHLARPLGELVPITSGYVSQGSLDRVLDEVITGIADSTADDWLLLSGLVFLNALATAAWLNKHKTLKLLVWDKKKRRYRQFHTDAEHLSNLWEQSLDGKSSSSSVA